MKRDFLKALGLADEAIDKIMAENGNDINELKTQIQATATERDGFKDQLKQRDTDIIELKKSASSADELKVKLTDLETKYQKDTSDLTGKLEKQNFDTKLDVALAGKVRNTKAAKALLDFTKISLKEDKLEGLDSQLESLKQSDAFLFVDATPGKPAGTPPPAGGTGSGGQTVSLKDAITEKVQSQFPTK